jgi:hypothetical protein
MKKINIAIIVFVIAIFCWSCGKQITTYVPQGVPFPYPTSYYFSNVNDSSAKKTLIAVDQLLTAVNQGNTQGTVVNSATLTSLYTTASYPSLQSLSTTLTQTDLTNFFDSIVLFSHSAAAGSNGVAGVGNSTLQPGVSYLQSGNGYVYSEIIRASIMEGLIGYQIKTIKLNDSINILKNAASLDSNWDAAFGYFAVPNNFPIDTAGSNYWGRYAKTLSPVFGLDTVIMDNYLIGRAAITNNYILPPNNVPVTNSYFLITDANTIIAGLDRLVIGAAIYELGQAQTNDSLHDDVVARAHLSTSWGLINSLNYKAGRNDNSQVGNILTKYGTNFYNFNYGYQHVDSLKTYIGSFYGISNAYF